MMRLFIVSRTDVPDLDQFTAFVVKAKSSDDAYKIAMPQCERFGEAYGSWSVTEITEDWPDEVLLSQFNAG